MLLFAVKVIFAETPAEKYPAASGAYDRAADMPSDPHGADRFVPSNGHKSTQ
jgi:hypothetical protein